MSKLFKLKEWLTLDEAATHISSLLGEPATVADLYRFVLDGHLTLSIDFVNRVYARKGKWVGDDAIQFVRVDVLLSFSFFQQVTSTQIFLNLFLAIQHGEALQGEQ